MFLFSYTGSCFADPCHLLPCKVLCTGHASGAPSSAQGPERPHKHEDATTSRIRAVFGLGTRM